MGDSERASPLYSAQYFALQSEIAKLSMQLLRYRQALVAAGIEPPDADGRELLEMWESCRSVIRAAQNCVAQLGTSKELLAERWA